MSSLFCNGKVQRGNYCGCYGAATQWFYVE